MLLEETNKIEVSNMLADLMTKGIKLGATWNAIESLEQPLERMQVMNLYLFQEIP
jgi:hypothetical protein